MSASRKDFDVKQILRIRWRWLGHPPASPAPHAAPPHADFSSSSSSSGGGRHADGSHDDPSGSATDAERWSAPLAPWASCARPEGSGVQEEVSGEGCATPREERRAGEEEEEEELQGAQEESNRMDSDSSSCRSSTSSQTLSSSQAMEPCSPDELFQASGHAEDTFRKMECYLRHKQLCDVVLLAGDRRIPAHRLVLSSVSDYFAAMFTSDVREAKQEEVKMEGVDPDALWALVQYAYTGRLELREDTIESLLAASCLLQLSAVVQACCSFLIKQLHPSNCLGIRSFADAQGCQELHKVAHDYTMERFLDVMRHLEFLLLSPDEVEKLLSSDDVNVPDEEAMMGALLSWVQHDCAGRQHHLARLLACIRLPLLASQCLADMESNPLLWDSVECQRLLMEAMKYHLLPERRPLLQSPRTRPRKATVGTLFAVGGMDATKGATTIEQYCLRSDSWKQAAVMSGRRLQFGVAVLEGRLYVVGGRDGLKTLSAVECYNPRSRSWSAMPPMATNRHGLGVAVLGGPMYAVGGHDGWSYLSSVERWDPQSRQWSFVSSMATPRSTVGVAVLNGKLYAVGGRDGSSCLSSVECFDPHTNAWSGCAPMAMRRGGVGVATWNGFLYAIGGHDAPASSLASRLSDCVERYDPKTDTWTTAAPMRVSRDAVGVCLLGDRLYAVGGYDGQTYLNAVEAYDPQTNEWTQVAPLCLGRAGTCVVAVKL
uniref:Kelch-like family member 5 n=1 Tax=Scleropages formosus TaxID=113540 RepID=A0A8C9VS48_SCLFO